ncbi:MAG: helix-turn-helix transcriptional regulator [Saprospiraceae bacterium]|nr:helix-turn-helix transcriptional regulator [Saprospiraceae bacterium]
MKNKVKIYRAMHNLSQEDLARIIGVSRQTIHFIERNKYVPSTVLALKLARHFEVMVEELFELDKDD